MKNSFSYTLYHIWEVCQKVAMQPNWLSAENESLWYFFYPRLFSSRFCLHLTEVLYLNLILKCGESPRNTGKVWLTHISKEGKPRTPFYGPCSSKAHMNFSGNSAKSKMVKQGSGVSNQISSVCLCLANCYAEWHSFIVFNHLSFNIFLFS